MTQAVKRTNDPKRGSKREVVIQKLLNRSGNYLAIRAPRQLRPIFKPGLAKPIYYSKQMDFWRAFDILALPLRRPLPMIGIQSSTSSNLSHKKAQVSEGLADLLQPGKWEAALSEGSCFRGQIWVWGFTTVTGEYRFRSFDMHVSDQAGPEHPAVKVEWLLDGGCSARGKPVKDGSLRLPWAIRPPEGTG